MAARSSNGVASPTLVLRLYVVGDSPRSLQARANLAAICREHFPDRHQVEVVDILDEPLRMIEDEIPVTPALVKIAPPPVQRMLGDLSDRRKVLLLLGVEAASA